MGLVDPDPPEFSRVGGVVYSGQLYGCSLPPGQLLVSPVLDEVGESLMVLKFEGFLKEFERSQMLCLDRQRFPACLA